MSKRIEEMSREELLELMMRQARSGISPHIQDDEVPRDMEVPIVFDKTVGKASNGTFYIYIPLEWSIRVGDFIEADVRPESDPDVPLGRTMFKVTARGNSPSITIPKKWGMVQGDRVIVKVYRRIDDEDSGSPFERLDKRLFERGSVLI